MVEGTGLENQRRKRPQVRILSFPPNKNEQKSEAFLQTEGDENLELALGFLSTDGCKET